MTKREVEMAAIKIPKYIRQKMHRIAYLHATANKEMQVVEAWLENQGFDTSMQGLRCGNGYSLEELDYGNDCTDELCKSMENGFGLTTERSV
jgi:hypothetical protein